MTVKTLLLWFVVTPALGQGQPLPAEPRPAEDPALARVRQSVRYWEQQLAREIDLRAKGVGTERGVEEARVALAKDRHQLALRESRPESALEQSKLILQIRGKQVQRLQGLVAKGFATELQLTEARRREAAARFFVAQGEGGPEALAKQLRHVAEMSKKEVGLLNKLRDQVVPAWELHRAENRVICAEYLLARLHGAPEDAARELRRHVAVCEDEWKKVVDLRKKGAAFPFEEYLVRNNLLNAKIRLANVEQDRSAVTEHLGALIKLHEEMLALLPTLDMSYIPAEWARHFRNGLQNELEQDRWRLDHFRAGNPFFDDHAAAALDS